MEEIVHELENEKYRLQIIRELHPESPRDEENLGTMVCFHRDYNLGDEQISPDDLLGWDEWLQTDVLEPNGGEDAVVYLPVYLSDYGGGNITISTTGSEHTQVGWIYATKERFCEVTGYSKEELFNPDPCRIPTVGEYVKNVKGYEKKGRGKVIYTAIEWLVVDFDYGKIPSARNPEENMVNVHVSKVIPLYNHAEEMLKNEIYVYDLYLRGEVFGYVLEEKNDDGEFEEIDSCWGCISDNILEDIQGMLPTDVHDLLLQAV